ncbi:MAG: thiamine phosphate synthase, partial [Anaerovoracaceae bacterium]|nr:thiamine phosphate synthase [Anaerovoracaceae bacterium]
MNVNEKDLLLYAVTDRTWLGEKTLHQVVKESLDGGVTFVQLREKELDHDSFLEEAKDLKILCAQYGVPFVINDNVKIAMEMDADGVHVGQKDLPAAVVRAMIGKDKILGLSVSNVQEAIDCDT